MAKKLSSFSLQPRLRVLLCKYETTVPCEPFFFLCSHIFCEWYRMHLRGISFVACVFIDSFPECTVSDLSACEQLFYRKKSLKSDRERDMVQTTLQNHGAIVFLLPLLQEHFLSTSISALFLPAFVGITGCLSFHHIWER